MNNDEIKEFIKSFEENTQKIPRSKEYSLDCLVEAGIYTTDGELAQEYQEPK